MQHREGALGQCLCATGLPVFPAFEPFARGRQVRVTETRRRTDWAHFVENLSEYRYREIERVVLIMDQLHTHSPASRYEAFAPEEARRPADRLEIHCTPKHGSWLNMAEIQVSVLTRDVPERLGNHVVLQQHLSGWEQRRNRSGSKANWHFTAAEARIKLRKLYPTLEG